MSRPENAFLCGLSEDSYLALRPHLERENLAFGAQLAHEDEPMHWVYFPLTSLISMISISAAGESVETSMVGNEGAAGLSEACGSQVAAADFLVQVDGKALRAPARVVRGLAFSDPAFAANAWRLAELQLLESRQSTICQSKHTVDHRLPRWLLESADRTAGRNPLPITQEFLGAMLGVRRATVAVIAAQIQARGTVRYARGKLAVVDKIGLEASACLCRGAMVHHRARLGLEAFKAPGIIEPAPFAGG
jgi:CRP-like cAMP-binding protein